jgi:acetolactate synthase I/III small subunit
MSKRSLTALIQNQNGVLTRLMGLFNKHQFDIENLSVGYTDVEGVSKMTVLVGVGEDDHKFKQLVKQINKQIDVLFVSDLAEENVVAKELEQLRV